MQYETKREKANTHLIQFTFIQTASVTMIKTAFYFKSIIINNVNYISTVNFYLLIFSEN